MSGYPRITYQTSERAFDRLFREQSLEETKQVVRKKLGLSSDAPIELSQLRDGRRIDLEDDDDFEAFRALTKASFHATVQVVISGNTQPSSNSDMMGVPREHEKHSNESALVQLHDMDVMGTSLPQKRRNIASSSDHAMRSASPFTHQSALDDAEPSSSRAVPSAVAHRPASRAMVPPHLCPATSNPTSNTKKVKPSVQTQIAQSGGKKRKSAKYVLSGDESTQPNETLHKKRKINGHPSGREPFPEHERSNLRGVNMSSDTQKDHLRNEKSIVSTGDNLTYSGTCTATPTIADSSSPAGMALVTGEMPKLKKQKPGRANAANDLAKSKTGLVDPTEDVLLDPTKFSAGGASEKKIAPKASRIGDLTIARSGSAVQGHSPPPKRNRRRNKLMEEGNTVSRTSLSTSKSSRLAVVRKAVGWDVAIDAVEVATAASPKPTPDPRCPAQSPEFESEVERADSNEAHSVQMPGLARYSEDSEERVRTKDIPVIPKELENSEVHVQGYGEGSSSDESSTEGEEGAGAVPPTRQEAFVTATSVPTHLLEDQLTALIHGPEKRSPHKSVLDEIPSSSDTGDEISSEDLILDEEDTSRQPSRKQMKVLSTIPLTPMESEATSDGEDITSLSVYMDTSHVVPPHSAPPTVNEAKGHASLSSEASEQAGVDAESKKPQKARDQQHSISPPTSPDEFGAIVIQPCMKSKLASPESDATVINTGPTTSPILASTQHSKGTILVPASSPVTAQDVANNGEKTSSQDEIDDVEPADEPLDRHKESDPIEAEPTETSVTQLEPTPRKSRRQTPRSTLKPLFVSQQPYRRSGRLASRGRSEDGKFEQKPRGDNASPPANQEVGSLRPASSQVERTNLAFSKPTQLDASSVIEGYQTKSQGPVGEQSSSEDDSSTSEVEAETPVPSRRRTTVASQGERGREQLLFLPGSSQTPRAGPSLSASGSVNESEKASILLSRKTPTRSTSVSTPFRRLTDISSQEDILFSKSKTARRVVKNAPSVKANIPFVVNDDGEQDEESTTSSEDTVLDSHIPKERRAGAARRRKGQGLSSLG